MARETNPLVVGRVVGDVLDRFPRGIPLRIIYSSREITNGREFKPSQVVRQPRVEIGGNDLRTFYTLVRTESPSYLAWCPSSLFHRKSVCCNCKFLYRMLFLASRVCECKTDGIVAHLRHNNMKPKGIEIRQLGYNVLCVDAFQAVPSYYSYDLMLH